MTQPTDVVDLIDEAIHDWTVSYDAMRWAPPEPNWDQPPIPLRAEGFRYLTDVQGMDGWAAAAYGAMQMRQIGRSVNEAFRKYAEVMAEAAKKIQPLLDKLSEQPVQETSRKSKDRPSWQSPYGPPRKRF